MKQTSPAFMRRTARRLALLILVAAFAVYILLPVGFGVYAVLPAKESVGAPPDGFEAVTCFAGGAEPREITFGELYVDAECCQGKETRVFSPVSVALIETPAVGRDVYE